MMSLKLAKHNAVKV